MDQMGSGGSSATDDTSPKRCVPSTNGEKLWTSKSFVLASKQASAKHQRHKRSVWSSSSLLSSTSISLISLLPVSSSQLLHCRPPKMLVNSLSFFRMVALLGLVLPALVAAATYNYPLQPIPSHGRDMGRTQFPSTLADLLHQGWIGNTQYSSARVTPLANPILSDDQVIQALREDAHTRRLVVLGGPHFRSQGSQGFTAAFPREDRIRPRSLPRLRVRLGDSRPQSSNVHINGFAAVENAPRWNKRLSQHPEPAYGVGRGTVVSTHELFETLPHLM